MKIRNFTPHPIVILNNKNEVIEKFQSEGIIRLNSEIIKIRKEGDIQITKTIFGNPEGLPEEKEGILLIVSQMIKSALPNRNDLVVPAELVRNDEGYVIGCKSLSI